MKLLLALATFALLLQLAQNKDDEDYYRFSNSLKILANGNVIHEAYHLDFTYLSDCMDNLKTLNQTMEDLLNNPRFQKVGWRHIMVHTKQILENQYRHSLFKFNQLKSEVTSSYEATAHTIVKHRTKRQFCKLHFSYNW